MSIGIGLGGAYMLGGLAKAADDHARFSRLADAAADGFSETALTRSAEDDGVLAIARRIDTAPAPAPDAAVSNRQLQDLNQRLQKRLDRGGALLLRASLGGAYNPAMKPFYFPGALEGSRELDCLTQAVYYEARGETPSGQAAVAQVVLNRARNPAFPKTICGVVFQRAESKGCQFSFACDGSTLKDREPGAWRRARTVASRALDGFVMAEVGSATHFHTLNVAPMWGPSLLRVAQVGMHVFYRFGGRAGAPSAFTAPVEMAASDTADGSKPAAAVLTAGPPLVEGGVGGPATRPVEPASAPALSPTPAPEKSDAKLVRIANTTAG